MTRSWVTVQACASSYANYLGMFAWQSKALNILSLRKKYEIESLASGGNPLVEKYPQAQKAPSQQFVDVFAKYYTPLVLVAAVGVMVLPWLVFQQPFAPWFYNGLVLLVISCPCALVISTPVSIVSAIGNASRQGVLIKGGAYLEEMGLIKAIAFDKTGTLTQGRPVVTDIVVTNGYSENDFLAMAAGIEKWSEHPLAQSIVAKAKGLKLQPATHFMAKFTLLIKERS